MDEDKQSGLARRGRLFLSETLLIRTDQSYSGMPLLDLLKELNVEAEAPQRAYSSAEDWISMSTASGLNYPFPTGAQCMSTSSDVLEDLQQGTQAELGMGDLWPRVTAIAPQLLLDK